MSAAEQAGWPQVSGRPPLIGMLDPSADRYLRACVAVLRSALGIELVGVYLYSSAVLGDFIPGRSDLDVVVVVRRPLAREPALDLARQVCAVVPPFPTKGLDLTVVTLECARAEHASRRVELKLLTFFGRPITADDEPADDTRVVMHFACCRDHALALAGPPARDVFAPVSLPEYLVALGRELHRSWMPPHYTILNACRDLRFIAEGVICSKVTGGLWALGAGYDRWLIEAALGWQRYGVGPVIDGCLVDPFVASVLARLSTAAQWPGPPEAQLTAPARSPEPPIEDARAALGRHPDVLAPPLNRTPLVSCVLASDGDLAATARAAGWFTAQDYPARELIVVAPPPAVGELSGILPDDPAIRVVSGTGDIRTALDIGSAHALGEFIAVWDQNAWYAPWRLSYQAGALVRTSHELSAATAAIAWDPVAGQGWAERSNPVMGHRQLLAATVCLTRAAWTRWPFAARSSWEPAEPGLLDPPDTPVHTPRGAHYTVLVKPGAYVAGIQPVRFPPDAVENMLGNAVHAFTGEAGASAFAAMAAAIHPDPLAAAPPSESVNGSVLDPSLAVPAFAPEPGPELVSRPQSDPVPEPGSAAGPAGAAALPAVDGVDTLARALLPGNGRQMAVPATAVPTGGAMSPSARSVHQGGRWAPRVSCIMPTFNRRRFIAQACRNVARQDYPDLELVVIDDGTEPVADLLAGLPNCRYVRLDERVTIGRKRNLACEVATGDVIVQWDDDDWYGPHRVSRQVMQIVNGSADATGIGVNLLLDVRSMRMWSTREREAADPLFASIEAVAGGTLAYAKDLWRRVGGYPDASIGEDVGLMQLMADAGGRIAPMSNQGAYVYIRHGRNSWRFDFPPDQGPPGWNESHLPGPMDEADVAFYASLRDAPRHVRQATVTR